MRYTSFLVATMVSSQQFFIAEAVQPIYPEPFTSNFHQPSPPLVKSSFKAHWIQHKWNENISHIASGYMYSSQSSRKVRVDEAYDGALGSSLFDYSNVTAGGVDNTLWLLTPYLTSPAQFFRGYEQPAFPLIEADILINGNAVYAGAAADQHAGDVIKWNFLFAQTLPTTLLVDSSGIVHGWDYWDTNERTYATTRLFNIVIGDVPGDVFQFPSSGRSEV